jgi:hypothetical protein
MAEFTPEPLENPTDAEIEAWQIDAWIAEAENGPSDAEIEEWEIEAAEGREP